MHEAYDGKGNATIRQMSEAAAAGTPKVAIIMGSDSDWPTLKTAADACAEFGVACEVRVAGLFATRILASGDPVLLKKITAFQARLASESKANNRNLQSATTSYQQP